MKKAISILIAGAALTAGLLATSCRGKVTINSENGSDTIEFDTDSIRQININVQTTGGSSASNASDVSDEEAIAFIEEFYAMEGWDSDDLKKYLSASALKFVELDKEDYFYGNEVAIDGKYAGWDLVMGDPVGETDLLKVTKAKATGDGRYEKSFTTAYWGDHSQKSTSSLFYTVERIDGQLKITKVENEEEG